MTTVERMRNVLDSVFEGEIDSSAVKESDNLREDLEMNSISMLYMVMGLEEPLESVEYQGKNLDFRRFNVGGVDGAEAHDGRLAVLILRYVRYHFAFLFFFSIFSSTTGTAVGSVISRYTAAS